jgi:thiol-disulfide isomerase/thioredoxin
MQRILVPCATAALVLVGPFALAGVDDPDPLEILEAVDAAAKKVRGVEYEAEFFMEGASGPTGFRISGHVLAEENPGKEFLKLNIAGRIDRTDGHSEFHVITDGEDFVSLSKENKRAIRGKAAEGARLLLLPNRLLMQEFVHPTPFSDEIHGDSRKYEGTKTVAGVECDVVFVVYEEEKGRARWYFGRDDHLPRRVDRFAAQGDLTYVVVVKDLKVDPQFPEGAFAPVVPEGFKEQKYAAPVERNVSGLLPVGSDAPDWSLQTPSGEEVSLRSLRGKVVLIDFWATWCGPCKRAMPGIQKLHEHYAGKPVAIIGINCWEREGDPVAYMKEKSFTYGLLLEGDKVAEAYHVTGIPTFYVIGADGKIVYRVSGFDEDLEGRLARLIDGALEKAKPTEAAPRVGPVARRRI